MYTNNNSNNNNSSKEEKKEIETVESTRQKGEFPQYFFQAKESFKKNLPALQKLIQKIHGNKKDIKTEEYPYEQLIALLELNMESMLKAIELPYINKNHQLVVTDFFPELVKTMHDAIPEKYRDRVNLKVYLGPEVIKALLARIYQDLYEEEKLSSSKSMKKSPESKSLSLLGDFLKQSMQEPEYYLRKNTIIPPEVLLGASILMGYSLDVFFKAEPKEGAKPLTEEEENEIEKSVSESAKSFIKSADEYFDKTSPQKEAQKKTGSMLLEPNVCSYDSEIQKRLKEGTSTLDLMAFQVDQIAYPEDEKKGEHKLIQPNIKTNAHQENTLDLTLNHLNILYDFINGKYQFIPGSEDMRAEIAIGSLAALLQMGFLELEKPEIICEKLKAILELLKNEDERNIRGMSLPKEAYIKFQMLVRTAYNACANNRAYKAAPNSPLALLLEISNQISLDQFRYSANEIDKGITSNLRILMPFFAESFPANSAQKMQGAYLKELEEYRLDYDSFIKNHTDHGILYHGTSAANVIPILANSFVLSTNKQGLAIYGSGVYATESKPHASHYGFVLQMLVKNNPNLRIFDRNKIRKDSKLFNKLEKEQIEKKYSDLNELLKYEYGVDILVDDHTSIQNMEAVKLNKDVELMLKNLAKDFSERAIKDKNITSFVDYFNSYQLMRKLGVDLKGACDPINIIKNLKDRRLALIYAMATLQDDLVKSILSEKKFDKNAFSLKDLLDEYAFPSSIDYAAVILRKAAAYGCYNTLAFLLKKGMDVDFVEKKGLIYNEFYPSALMCAAENGHTECVKLLLKYQAKTDIDINELSALSRASQNGHLHIVNLLLEQEANVDQRLRYGDPPLIYALRNKHKEVVKALLAKNANCNVTYLGSTPLILAASFVDLETLKIIIGKTKNINSQDFNKVTALMCAAYSRNLEAVQCLCENKADLNLKAQNGFTAFSFAIAAGKWPIVKYLAEQPSLDLGKDKNQIVENLLRLVQKIEKDPLFPMSSQLSSNVKITTQTQNKDILLLMAAEAGMLEVIQYLQKNGVDLNTQDGNGNTPLMIAIRARKRSVVEYFIQQEGINLDAKNTQGETALTLLEKSELSELKKNFPNFKPPLDLLKA